MIKCVNDWCAYFIEIEQSFNVFCCRCLLHLRIFDVNRVRSDNQETIRSDRKIKSEKNNDEDKRERMR